MLDRIDLLLNKALEALDPDERDELLRSLLLGRLTGGMSSAAGPIAAPRPGADPERLASLFSGDLEASADTRMKVLPIRLPEADHERLRQFCQSSGFSMAVVIRTLVGRFLDRHAGEADHDE